MTDAINPAHYQGFSNGSEVIDITECLTYNGGAAVKYLARATRLDGGNKGAILEDLHKSAWYVAREIGRIESGEPDDPTPVAPVLTLQGKPRVWDAYSVVPEGVTVHDKDGDVWRGGAPDCAWRDDWAPFTEILSA